MKAISTQAAPAAVGPYSQGIEASGLVFISGQLPIDPVTSTIPEGVAAQAERAFANVIAILTITMVTSRGSSPKICRLSRRLRQR